MHQQRRGGLTSNMTNNNSGHVQWREHKDPHGRIYLSNPVTGETRWLWTRHRDNAKGLDYIANHITGEREWVTAANEHLCPKPKGPPVSGTRTSTRSMSGGKVGSKSATAQLAAAMALARQQCRPNESPMRNPISGRIDIRNNTTGAIRTIVNRTPSNTSTALILVQRTFRMIVLRRIKITDKLQTLRDAVQNVESFIAPGKKYDLASLRRVAESSSATSSERKVAAELLLQLGEVVTQAMLKVDGIESQGCDRVRMHRKRSVKRLLALSDLIEEARGKLANP